MKAIKLIGASIAALMMASASSAAIFTVTYAGTVIGGTDFSGVFGAAAASLDGLAYTATYKFDSELGVRNSYRRDLDQIYGGENYGVSSPSFGAVLTIGGISFSIGGGEQASHNNAPSQSLIASAVFASDPSNGYDYSYIVNGLKASGVPTPMETSFSANGSPSTTLFVSTFQIAQGVGFTSVNRASGNLAPTSVTVISDVPEPASWAMMIMGFGAVGGSLRQRRRTQVSYS